MTVTLGVDVSTRRIAVVGYNTYGRQLSGVFVLDAKGRRAADRFPDLIAQFDALLGSEVTPQHRVMVEDVPYVQNARSTLDLAAVIGAVRALCVVRGIQCETANTMTWRWAIGAGGRKSDIRDWAAARGFEHKLQDVIDAYCIAVYGSEEFKSGGYGTRVPRAAAPTA